MVCNIWIILLVNNKWLVYDMELKNTDIGLNADDNSIMIFHFVISCTTSCTSCFLHYSDVIMSKMSQITSLTIVHSTAYPSADQRKHQSSASLAFVRGIHQWPVNSPHKWPVMRKMFPFDDVIMLMMYVRYFRWLIFGPKYNKWGPFDNTVHIPVERKNYIWKIWIYH